MNRAHVLTALLCLASSSAALAQDADEPQGGEVIQNRKFAMGHEFVLEFAGLPLDPFAKGIGGTARYAFHIADAHAIELSGTYAFNLDSDLTDQLRKNFGVQRQALPSLIGTVELNYMVTPFYGKFALVNRTNLYEEVFFVLGVTGSYWENDKNNPIRIGPDAGGGVRFFLAQWFSWRFDMRYAVQFAPTAAPLLADPAPLDGVLYLGTGFALNFGGGA